MANLKRRGEWSPCHRLCADTCSIMARAFPFHGASLASGSDVQRKLSSASVATVSTLAETENTRRLSSASFGADPNPGAENTRRMSSSSIASEDSDLGPRNARKLSCASFVTDGSSATLSTLTGAEDARRTSSASDAALPTLVRYTQRMSSGSFATVDDSSLGAGNTRRMSWDSDLPLSPLAGVHVDARRRMRSASVTTVDSDARLRTLAEEPRRMSCVSFATDESSVALSTVPGAEDTDLPSWRMSLATFDPNEPDATPSVDEALKYFRRMDALLMGVYPFQGTSPVDGKKTDTMALHWQKLSPPQFHTLQEYISCEYFVHFHIFPSTPSCYG